MTLWMQTPSNSDERRESEKRIAATLIAKQNRTNLFIPIHWTLRPSLIWNKEHKINNTENSAACVSFWEETEKSKQNAFGIEWWAAKSVNQPPSKSICRRYWAIGGQRSIWIHECQRKSNIDQRRRNKLNSSEAKREKSATGAFVCLFACLLISWKEPTWIHRILLLLFCLFPWWCK